MQVCNIQSNSFQGVYTPRNFSPTLHQEEMIKTIKNNFVNDSIIYRKGKNFHDFMESKGFHFLLSNGDYKDEIKVEIGSMNRSDNIVSQQNCGSFPDSRLDTVVEQAKAAWKENTANNILLFILGVAMVAFGVFGAIYSRK